ncbi:MAG: hypothetical protein AAGF12_11605 [Myxococcota bacterium]
MRVWFERTVSEQREASPLFGFAWRGGLCGLFAASAALLAYAYQYYRPADEGRRLYSYFADIPWSDLVVQVPTFGLLGGAWMSLALGLSFWVVARTKFPRATLLMLTPLLGGLAGPIPAIAGGVHFGAMSAPYVGAEILVPILSIGGLAYIATIARAEGNGWLRSIGATLVALILGSPVLYLGWIVLDFEFILPAVRTLGVVEVSAIGGGIIGGLLGLWVAVTVLAAGFRHRVPVPDAYRSDVPDGAIGYR